MKPIYLSVVLLIFGVLPYVVADSPDPSLETLNGYCNVPGSPFNYDKQTHRYSITITESKNGKTVTNDYFIHFDPFTGTPLPGGEGLFYDIDSKFAKTIHLELAGVTDLKRAKEILGKPDNEYGANEYFEGELFYKSLSKTNYILIQKTRDSDVVQVIVAGKLKETNK